MSPRWHVDNRACPHSNDDVCPTCDFDGYYESTYPDCPWREATPTPDQRRNPVSTRIVSVPDLIDLPVGSIVRAQFRDGSQADHYSVRIDGDHMAATGGWSLRGGQHWKALATWGPNVELTVVTTYDLPGGVA